MDVVLKRLRIHENVNSVLNDPLLQGALWVKYNLVQQMWHETKAEKSRFKEDWNGKNCQLPMGARMATALRTGGLGREIPSFGLACRQPRSGLKETEKKQATFYLRRAEYPKKTNEKDPAAGAKGIHQGWKEKWLLGRRWLPWSLGTWRISGPRSREDSRRGKAGGLPESSSETLRWAKSSTLSMKESFFKIEIFPLFKEIKARTYPIFLGRRDPGPVRKDLPFKVLLPPEKDWRGKNCCHLVVVHTKESGFSSGPGVPATGQELNSSSGILPRRKMPVSYGEIRCHWTCPDLPTKWWNFSSIRTRKGQRDPIYLQIIYRLRRKSSSKSANSTYSLVL